jgi:hypothetical protein
MGRSLVNYFAVAHPSQPNYIAQIGGSTLGVTGDGVYNLPQSNLVDLMETKGVSWKTYQENYPGNCDPSAYLPATNPLYYRKHNPFISFDNIRTNAVRCAKIVNSAQLDIDLANAAFPQYSYYTPNINNDAHNTNITYAGLWLDNFLSLRLSKFPANTFVVVTWDEDDYTEANQVLTFFLDPTGSLFKQGSVDNTLYNHYSLLATIEQNWGQLFVDNNLPYVLIVLFSFGQSRSLRLKCYHFYLELDQARGVN